MCVYDGVCYMCVCMCVVRGAMMKTKVNEYSNPTSWWLVSQVKLQNQVGFVLAFSQNLVGSFFFLTLQ